MKNYYAVASTYGYVSIYSEYGQPTLHAFSSKKERDKWVYDNDVLNGNINHRCWEIKAKEAYRAYRDKWTGELIAVYH